MGKECQPVQSASWGLLLQEIEEAALILDDQMGCVAANPAACELFGFPHERLLHRSIADFITPECKLLLECLPPQQRLRPLQIVRSDQAVRSIEATVILNRKLQQHLWLLRDVTPSDNLQINERERMEQVWQQVLSTAFMQSSPVGMLVLDRQFRCVKLNPAIAEITQVSLEDHIGKTVWDCLPGIAAQQTAIFEQVLATGQPVLNLEVTGELIQQPGFDRTWLVSYFPIQAEAREPLQSSSPEAMGVGIIVREITEVKRAQTELKRKNAALAVQVQQQTVELQQALRFETMLKRITDKVRDSLDEAQILQTAVDELTQELETLCCDTGLYDLEKGVSLIAYESIQADVSVAKGTIVQMSHFQEIYDQLLSGQYIHFCWLPNPMQTPVRFAAHRFTKLAVPLVDEHGVIGDLCMYRPHERPFEAAEIRLVQQCANQCAIALRQSRLYQAAQQQVNELERLHRLKDDFLNTVSHELRTPMSTIKMAVQMLELHLGPLGVLTDCSTPIASYFRILSEECDREILLINDLLDLARLDGETELYQITTIDLTTWLPHVAEVFQARIASQQQQLTFAIDPDLPRLSTDLFYLERIVVELLTNACKYTPAHETIHLTAHLTADSSADSSEGRTASPRIAIQIENTGVEIPMAERDRIFDKFYRIPNSDPWKHGGTGWDWR